MWVFAQPPVQLGLAFSIDRVADLAAVSFKQRQPKLLGAKFLRLRRGVPTPLRHRTKGHGLVVLFRKGLQSGDVGGESKLSVPNREWRERIESSNDRVVTTNEILAIDQAEVLGTRRAGLKQSARGCEAFEEL